MDPGMLKRAVEQEKLLSSAGGGSVRWIPKVREEKAPPGKKGVNEAQKLLLTYISDEPEKVYPAIKPFIEPGDFSEGILRTCAEELFKQIEENDLRIGAIVSRFEEPEEQRLIAEIFDTGLDPSLSTAERENALTDLVIKVKKDSLKRQSFDDDEDPISRTIKEKKVLEKLEKMRITI